MSISPTTNQLEHDKFVENNGEVAVRVVSTSNTATISNLPSEYPLPADQITTLTPPANPSEYPLPASQVSTLTPPAAITGFATSAKQDSQITLETTLNSLTETLQELVQRLAPLGGAMASTAQLRVMQTSVPSTAVTGPQTSAQFIAAFLTSKIALENMNAVNSNVNNCVGV